GIYLPPEHDSRPTTRIIRLEHEAFALIDDEGHQVHRSVLMAGLPLRNHARPGNMRVDRLTLVSREQSRIPLVTQHRQARFLVEQLAAKGIHHAHRAGLDGVDHRVVRAAPFHEGSERTSKRRRNGRMTGSAMNASVSASPYAAPAGVSALYSVRCITSCSGR